MSICEAIVEEARACELYQPALSFGGVASDLLLTSLPPLAGTLRLFSTGWKYSTAKGLA